MSNVVCVFFLLLFGSGLERDIVIRFFGQGSIMTYHHIIRGVAISHARIELITTKIEVQNTQARLAQGKNA